jgi:hypothetical protein
MATVSAGFSIVGLTSVFVGAFGPVVALCVVLEAGKLRAVELIGMRGGSRRLRLFLVAAVATLMGLMPSALRVLGEGAQRCRGGRRGGGRRSDCRHRWP